MLIANIAAIALSTQGMMGSSMPAPDVFEQKIPGSLVSFKMVRLPGGEVTIKGKKIKVKPFAIAETETTWDVYDIFAFRLDMTQEEQAKGVSTRIRPSKPYGAPDRGFGHKGYPSLCSTKDSVNKFCDWLNLKTGKKYRMATEAEWTYACLAGQPAPKDIEPFAWFWDNAEDKTHPVKTKKPNAWGLYDMLGNVAEWVVTEDDEYVVCGGSWKTKADQTTPFSRQTQQPSWNETDPQNPKSRWWLSDGFFVGFRVVCEE